MTLGAIGSSTSILQTLEAKGLSESKAKLVQSDLDASLQSATGLSGAKPDIASVRGVLDQKIASDVASGALTQEDATAISNTLDDMQGSSAGGSAASGAATTTAGAAPSSGGAGAAGGGGGGGSETKTELSRVVVVTGAIKTTTITYTDGTTTTETSASTGDEPKKAGAAAPVQSAGAGSADAEYKPKIVPGILVDALA